MRGADSTPRNGCFGGRGAPCMSNKEIHNLRKGGMSIYHIEGGSRTIFWYIEKNFGIHLNVLKKINELIQINKYDISTKIIYYFTIKWVIIGDLGLFCDEL